MRLKNIVITTLIFLLFGFLSCKKQSTISGRVVNHFTREPVSLQGISLDITEHKLHFLKDPHHKTVDFTKTDNNGELLLDFDTHLANRYSYMFKLRDSLYTYDMLSRLKDTVTWDLRLYDVGVFKKAWEVSKGRSLAIEIDAVQLTRLKIILDDQPPYYENWVSYVC